MRAQRTLARHIHARFNATLIMISSMQYAFSSCSFNYKSDYNNEESNYKDNSHGTRQTPAQIWKVSLQQQQQKFTKCFDNLTLLKTLAVKLMKLIHFKS